MYNSDCDRLISRPLNAHDHIDVFYLGSYVRSLPGLGLEHHDHELLVRCHSPSSEWTVEPHSYTAHGSNLLYAMRWANQQATSQQRCLPSDLLEMNVFCTEVQPEATGSPRRGRL